MSNYKHFSKLYILVRVIALLFHCALSVVRACARRRAFKTKSVEFSGESQDGNFPWLSNIYMGNIPVKCKLCLGKEHISKQRVSVRALAPFDIS